MDLIPRPRAGSMTRSLVCDAQGIIVAETVFRCVRCATVLSSVPVAQQHYYQFHMESDEELSGIGQDKDREPVDTNTDMRADDQVSPSSSLSDSHPNVVKALTAAFTPCPGPGRGCRGASQMDVGANLNGT